MSTNIRVAFHYTDKEMMKKILTSMIHPKLQYAAVVWSPNVKKGYKETRKDPELPQK